MAEKLILLFFFVLFTFPLLLFGFGHYERKGNNTYSLFFHSDQSGYQHVWPEIRLGWQIIVGTVIGAIGAACGSIGGVGGGGIFVPMLTLVIGFDSKSAAAVSKCMITGASLSAIYYNLKLRHPTLDLPIVDFDIMLLIQPMAMLGISIGVALNVVFADWMVTFFLVLLSLVISIKAFFTATQTWRTETLLKQENKNSLDSSGTVDEKGYYKLLPNDCPRNISMEIRKVSIIENICWKEFGLLVLMWFAYLAIQISKNYTATCSAMYWALNFLQVPVSVGLAMYTAIGLYKGKRVVKSKGDGQIKWRVDQLLLAATCGILAGVVGGLLGIGSGFIMGPLFIELGIPPQVASATATFGMTFSSAMSVVEYYLLHRFPIPYAIYLVAIAIVAAFVGQHVITKLVVLTGRASLIIFVLAFTVFVSAIALGGVGTTSVVGKIDRGDYMGFESLCHT